MFHIFEKSMEILFKRERIANQYALLAMTDFLNSPFLLFSLLSLDTQDQPH